MTYLDLARSALNHCEQSEQRSSNTTSSDYLATTAGEKSEGSEKSPAAGSGGLTLEEAERLKVLIIAAVTVEPEEFDRERYEELVARWNAYEAVVTRPSDEEQVA